MSKRTRLVALAGAAAVSIVIPGVAEARTKSVSMGVPPKSGEAFQRAFVDVNDFFPHGVTINVGDRVRFRPAGRLPQLRLPAQGRRSPAVDLRHG